MRAGLLEEKEDVGGDACWVVVVRRVGECVFCNVIVARCATGRTLCTRKTNRCTCLFGKMLNYSVAVFGVTVYRCLPAPSKSSRLAMLCVVIVIGIQPRSEKGLAESFASCKWHSPYGEYTAVRHLLSPAQRVQQALCEILTFL